MNTLITAKEATR